MIFFKGFQDELTKLSSLDKWKEHFETKSSRKKLKWDDWKTRSLGGAGAGALLAALMGRKGDWFSRSVKGALGGGAIGSIAPAVGRNISSSRAMEKLKKESSVMKKDLSDIISKGKREEAGVTGLTGGALGALLGLSLGNKKLRSALIGAGLGGVGAIGSQHLGRHVSEKRHGKAARGLTWQDKGRFDKVSSKKWVSNEEKDLMKLTAAMGAAGGFVAPQGFRIMKNRFGSAAVTAALLPLVGLGVDRAKEKWNME